MRAAIADLVFPVIEYGLQLKERLERGEAPILETEQVKLKGLLQSNAEARRDPDFGGDSWVERPAGAGMTFTGSDVGRRGRGDGFLGVRYALACWLDELFTIDSPWEAQWKDRILEYALFGTRSRYETFWDQAERAQARSADALEVYFLCVMLGFRGKWRDQPAELQNWVTAVRNRLRERFDREWPGPDGLDPPLHVPPRRGRERFQRLVVAAAVVALLAIFAAVLLGLPQLFPGR
jgi:type VI secretion system protein ImpK